MIAQTSLDAFGAVAINARQQQVFYALRGRVLNDREIAAATGLPINAVTPRRGELADKGLVKEAYTGTDPATGRKSTYWEWT